MVAYCGVCGTDLHIYQGHMDQRVQMPQVIGHEMSGQITELGAGVDGFNVGDRVVVRPLNPCEQCPACLAGHDHVCQQLKFLGIDTPGAFQSSWTVPAHTLHRIPDALSMEHAAMIEPIAVACHDVRMGQVSADDHVVIIGGGPIGTLIALVARVTTPSVTLCEINPFRIELARRLGLDAIDPNETDLLARVDAITGGAGADVVFEVSGSDAGCRTMTQLARVRGRIVVVAIFPDPRPVDLFRFFWRELRLFGARVYERQDFDRAIQLAAENALPLDDLITARYPLAGLGEAMQQMDAGGRVMKVLIDVESS